MKIIFASNGSIGLAPLAEISKFHEIVAVYTSAPYQKGKKMIENKIHEFARMNNISIKKPSTFKNSDVKDEFLAIEHDIVIVASYGFLLPNWFLESGKFRAINIHPSSLPKYRGAAPIQRAIQNGDNNLDICIIEMTKDLDAGRVIVMDKIDILQEEAAVEIFEKVNQKSPELLMQSLALIESGTAIYQDQTGEPSYAKKIDKSELLLEFNKDVEILANKIRAFNANGSCYFVHNDQRVKIHKSDFEIAEHDFNNGYIDDKFNIYCQGGFLKPTILQKEGKAAVRIKEFLNGLR